MTTKTRPRFTRRQVQVVRCIARGLTMDEIGAELRISGRTAKAHTEILRAKLGVAKKRLVPQAFMEATGINPWAAE